MAQITTLTRQSDPSVEQTHNPNSMSKREFDALVVEHLPLVRSVVMQVAAGFPRHVDREELVRAGTLGLVEAARRFDDSRGVPFAPFAAQRIRGAILDASRGADWAPRSVRAFSRLLDATRQEVANELGYMPDNDEISEALGISRAELMVMQERINRSAVATLNDRASHDGEEQMEIIDLLIDRTAVDLTEAVESEELHGYLRAAVHLLPERHRLVIVGYFLEGKASDDLAKFLNVTESRISQLRSEALEMLREGISAQYEESTVPGEPVPMPGRAARRRANYAAAIAAEDTWRERIAG